MRSTSNLRLGVNFEIALYSDGLSLVKVSYDDHRNHMNDTYNCSNSTWLCLVQFSCCHAFQIALNPLFVLLIIIIFILQYFLE